MLWFSKIFYKEPPPIHLHSKDVGFIVFPTRGRPIVKTSIIEKTWSDYAAISICHHVNLAYQEKYTITIWGKSIESLKIKIDDFISQKTPIETINPKNDWQTTTIEAVPWRNGNTLVRQRQGLQIRTEMEYAKDFISALRAYRDA